MLSNSNENGNKSFVSLNVLAKTFTPAPEITLTIANSLSYKKLNYVSKDTNYLCIGNDVDDQSDILTTLSNMKLKNYRRIAIAHIKINSLRNKFEMLPDIVSDKLDLFCW